MNMTKQRSSYNYRLIKSDMETPKPGSLTVPGESLSVKEILENYTNGIMPDMSNVGSYAKNPSLDDIDPTTLPDVDLVDIYEGLREINESIKALNQPVKGDQAVVTPVPNEGEGGTTEPK